MVVLVQKSNFRPTLVLRKPILELSDTFYSSKQNHLFSKIPIL